MIQSNILRACFDHSFSKQAFSIYAFINFYRVYLIKTYFKSTITKSQGHILHIKYVPDFDFIDFSLYNLNIKMTNM